MKTLTMKANLKSSAFTVLNLAATLALVCGLFASSSARAAAATKAATGIDLTAGASWSGGSGTGGAPNSSDVATWTSTSLGGTTLTLGSGVSWGGIAMTGATADPTIPSPGPLTLGANGIDLSTSANNMTINAPITLGVNQTWNVNSAKTLTVGGVISGNFGITNAGAGTNILTQANTYSGGTTINAGTLQIGGSAQSPLGTGSIAVNSPGTLAFNYGSPNDNFTNNISGNGTISQISAQEVGLAGTINFSGQINVIGGKLALGQITGTLNGSVSGQPSVYIGSAGFLSVGPAYVGGTCSIGNLTGVAGGQVNPTFGATVGFRTLSINQTVDGTNASSIVDAGSRYLAIIKTGSAKLTLSAANTYSGTNTLSAGTVNLGIAEIAGTSGPLGKSAAANAGNIVLNGGTLQYSSVNHNDYSGRFSTAASQQYNIDVNGQAVNFGTALTSSGGTLTLTNSSASSGSLTNSAANTYSGTSTLNGGILVANIAQTSTTSGPLGANGNIVFGGGMLQFTANSASWDPSARIAAGTTSGNMSIDTGGQSITFGTALTSSQSGGLTKRGTGTLTLSQAELYTGATTVSNGTLFVSGSLAAGSAVTVDGASSGTLGGSGTINGTVTLQNGGTLQPSASGGVNTLTLANATAPTFNTGSKLKLRVPTISTADQVALSSATPVFDPANLDLTIDTTGLSGNPSGLTIVAAAKGNGGITANPFHSITVVGNTTYTPTVHYNTSAGTITLDLVSSSYIVTYNGNGNTGGTVPTDNNAYAPGATVTVLSGTPTLTGYTFSSWSDGNGHNYTAGNTFTISANTTLTAQWTINSYTLTYNGNTSDGGSPPSPVTQNYNTTTIVAAAGVTKTGNTFLNWNTAANGGGTAYAAGSTFTFPGSNTTLYAQWVANNATTGFNQTAAGPWDYNTATNWVNQTINGTWNSDLTLSAGQTVTFATSTTLTTGLTFSNAGNYALTLKAAAAGTQSLTLGGDINLNTSGGTSANVTIGNSANHLNVDLGGVTRTMTVAASRTLTFNDVISGTGAGITKDGSGTLTFYGVNTFDGSFTVKNGTVIAKTSANVNAFGTGTITLGDSSGGPVTLLGSWVAYANPINLAANAVGPISIGDSGEYIYDNGTFKGPINLNGNNLNLIRVAAAYTATYGIQSAISGTGSLTISNACTGTGPGGMTLSGAINIYGNITNASSGSDIAATTIISGVIGSNVTAVVQNSATAPLQLSAANTYLGPTIINAGTLTFGASATLASTNLILAGGATLDVTGLTSGLALSGGKKFTAGGTGAISSGTITVASGKNLTLDSTAGAGLIFSGYNGGNGNNAANAPLLVTGASAGALALNGAPVTINTTAALAPGTYVLIAQGGSATGVTGSPGTLKINGVTSPAGYSVQVSGGQLTLTVPTPVLHHFGISPISSPQAPGVAITGITLTAQDVANNTVPSFTSTVTYGGTAGITGTSAAFTSGVLTGVSVTPVNAGLARTFTVSDGTHNGTATFDVVGAPVRLAVTSVPAGTTPGSCFTVTVTSQDANGLAAAATTATNVTLGLASGSGVLSGNTCVIAAGQSSVTLFLVTYSKVETITLNATNTGGSLATSAASAPIVVSAGPVATYWAVGSGNWDLIANNWKSTAAVGFTNASYLDGEAVTLDDSANGANSAVALLITNAATVFPASVTVSNTGIANYILSGNAIVASGALTKNGAGTLTLLGANTYTNGTTVNGGALIVNSALGGGGVTVGRATLSGSGTIGSPVTVQTGGTLTAGSNGLGQLTINSSLTLQAGSTNVMKISKEAGANDLITGISTLTYGGTLVAKNLGFAIFATGSSSFAVGDSFKLFNATNYAGAFANIVPAIPQAGMAWDTNQLAVSGTLKVVAGAAYLKLPNVFASSMVLQRGMSVPVWGVATPGAAVSVSYAGQVKNTTAAADGSWQVALDPMPANTNSQTLTVTSSGLNVVLTDVLVGDVWLCSGQSNMFYPLTWSTFNNQAVSSANYPQIRFLTVALTASTNPVADIAIQQTWTNCSPSTVPGLSAVAFYFGREIYSHTNVPIGLLSSSYGGTPCEAWTSLSALTNVPELKTLVDQENSQIAQGTRLIQNSAGNLFNAMIEPLIPFALRGAIWYQGESNDGNAHQYRVLLPTMIADWRARWGLGNFPFYLEQLVNYSSTTWPDLREAQLMTTKCSPNTGMAVGIDIGQYNDIHPTNKLDIGIRLAQWALARDYGFNIVPSGPLCRGCSIEGSSIRVAFDYAETGLMVGQKVSTNAVQEIVGGTLATFEIAGADTNYVTANAVIDGATVVVSAPSVTQPVWVRYGWSANPACNLYNRAGLPASPFRVTTNAVVKTPFTVSGGVANLTLNTSSNTTCWVDYKDDLTAPSWTPLFGPQTSTGASLLVTNYPAAVSNRFYRVNLWPY